MDAWISRSTVLIWFAAGLLAAYVLSRLLLLVADRILVHRRLLPSSFKAPAHFRGSLFCLLSVALAKSLVPVLDLGDRIEHRVDVWLSVAFVVSMAWLATRIVSVAKMVLYRKLDIASSDNLRHRKIRTEIQFVEKTALVFIYVVAFALVLMNFEGVRKVGSSLIASAGLAGVVLGFAAQRSLANFAAGLQIAFTQPIRIDDVVVVEGEWGRIEEITLTYVIVRIWDKRSLVLPLSYFVEKPFQNWTRTSADILGTVFLNVDFSTPIEVLRREFERVVQESPLWDRKVAVVQVTDATEKTLQVRFLVSARNSGDAFDLRCLVRERMAAFVNDRLRSSLPRVRLERDSEASVAASSLEPARLA